jgi:alkanesulfonate monooxygenase SsuD/methylene tetrahydromethanopterin reductase-like flavin-dependent oxidoreductase (luciferase family)
MATTFGCVLSSTIFGHTASPEAVRTRALQAETLGFDSIWLADHVVIPRHVASSYPYAAGGGSPFDPNLPFYEPISVLNFLAGCTQRVRLGMHVLIIPYRHPVLTAKMLATLDVLSGGRLILGAGVGWMAEEFAALGAPPYEERGAVTDE